MNRKSMQNQWNINDIATKNQWNISETSMKKQLTVSEKSMNRFVETKWTSMKKHEKFIEASVKHTTNINETLKNQIKIVKKLTRSCEKSI